jgi:hypothetical protein
VTVVTTATSLMKRVAISGPCALTSHLRMSS